MYDNKVVWPEEYRPWRVQVPFEYAIGFALFILYIDWRTDQQRLKAGMIECHDETI